MVAFAFLCGSIALAETAGPALEGWYEVQPRDPDGATIFTVQGWAVSAVGEVRIAIFVDGREVISGKPFLAWPGVAERFQGLSGTLYPGFQASIDPAAFGAGEHVLVLELSTADGTHRRRLQETRFVTAPPLTPFVALPILLLMFLALPAVAGFGLARRAPAVQTELVESSAMQGWRLHAAIAAFALVLLVVIVLSSRLGMVIPSERHGRFGGLANWDGNFYHVIAEQGYGAHAASAYAFFPLFPLVVRLVGFLPAPVELATSILNVAFFLGAIELMRRTGTRDRVLLLFAAMPFSVFFVANYTESLALLLCAAVLRSASADKPVAAFIAGVLAGMTRITGIPLVFLAVDAVRQRKWSIAAALAAGPPVGLAFFSIYLWITTGDPVAFLTAQQRFGRSSVATPGYLLNGLLKTVGDQREIGLWAAASAALILIGAAFLVARGRWGEGLYCATLIWLPVVTGRMTSINRYALLAVPVLLLAFSSIHAKRIAWCLFGIEALFAVYYAAQFGRQAWIG